MSHEVNTEYLEEMGKRFEGEDREGKLKVIEQLREDGFDSQADTLAHAMETEAEKIEDIKNDEVG